MRVVAERLRRGAGYAALAVLYAHRGHYFQFTTRAITQQTQYEISDVTRALLQAQRLGLVVKDWTARAPQVPYWRITVIGCEFVRDAAEAAAAARQ